MIGDVTTELFDVCATEGVGRKLSSVGQCQHGYQLGLAHGPKKGDVSLTGNNKKKRMHIVLPTLGRSERTHPVVATRPRGTLWQV